MAWYNFWRQKDAGGQIDSSWFNLGGQTVSGVPVNQVSAIQNSAVLACVSILATDIAKLPLRLYRRLPNGNKILAKSHWLAQLFNNPNNYQTRFEWLEHVMVNLLISGNAYSVILRNPAGIPTALIPINAQQVQLYESPDNADYFYFVSRNGLHETSLLRSLPLRIPSDDVFHVRWLSYVNSLWGSNRIDMAREAIGLTMALEESSARLMGSGARPSGLLTTDAKLTKETIERIAGSWQSNHGGPHRTGGTAVLEQGLKWQPLSFSSVDTQFIEQRRFQIEEIARVFRVPLYKLSITEDQPGSSLLQLEQDYVNGTLSAYCDRITAKLYKTFEIDEDEFEIAFDYEYAVKADIATRINSLRIGILAGLYTLNEARSSLSLPSVGPDGDTLMVPTNMMPLGSEPPDQANSQPGSDSTGKPGEGGDGDELHTDPNLNPDDAAPNS